MTENVFSKGVKWKHKGDSLTRITAFNGTRSPDEYGFWGHAWKSLGINKSRAWFLIL